MNESVTILSNDHAINCRNEACKCFVALQRQVRILRITL